MRARLPIVLAAVLAACGGTDTSREPEAPPQETVPTLDTPPAASPPAANPPAASPPAASPPAATGPTFAGEYSGSVADATSCSGGPVGRDTYRTTWRIDQNGDTAVVTTSGNCPPYIADVEPSGIVAQFRTKTCQPVTRDGETMTTVLLGGTLTLSGDTLTVTKEWLREFHDPRSGRLLGDCRTSTAATFVRVAR